MKNTSLKERHQKTLSGRYNNKSSLLSKSKHQTPTLKEVYELQLEHRNAHLLVEKLNDDDFKQAKQVLDKLSKIAAAARQAESTELVSAIELASKDLREFTGGGGLAGLIKKGVGALVKKITGISVLENPLVKTATFLSALEEGFSKLEDIINMHVKDYDKNNTTRPPMTQAGDDSAQKKLLSTAVEAFVPGDFFSSLKSLFNKASLPYAKDLNSLVKNILSVPAQNLANLINVVSSNPVARQAADMANDIVKNSTDNNASSSQRKVNSVEEFANTVVAAGASSKKSDTNNTKRVDDPKKVTQAFVNNIAKKSGQSLDIVKKVILALIRAKKIKSSFELTSEGKRLVHRNLGIITSNDAKNARRLYLESGGSSRKWVDLLCEARFEPKQDWIVMEERGKKKTKKQRMKKVAPREVKALSTSVNLKKAKKLKDDLKDELKDVNPGQIASILDAIPDYFIIENMRRKKIIESRRRVHLH